MIATLMGLALAAAPAAVPTGSDPLAHCSEIYSTMTMIVLQCGERLVLFADEQDQDPSRTLGLFEKNRDLGEPTAPQTERLQVGGGPRDVMRVGWKGAPEASLLFLSISEADHRFRTYGCMRGSRKDEPRCRSILDRVVLSGLPERFAARVRAPAAFHVAGRPLALPRGCTVKKLSQTHAYVTCDDGSNFTWFSGEASLLEGAASKMTEAWQARVQGTWEEVPCLLEGNPATCRHLSGRTQGEAIDAWIGKARLRGAQHLLASCIFPHSARFPELCSAVMRIPR